MSTPLPPEIEALVQRAAHNVASLLMPETVPEDEPRLLARTEALIAQAVSEALALAGKENEELRVMCAVCHTGMRLYHDDGELQDNTECPFIDWKRDSVSDIQAALSERGLAKLRQSMEERK